MLQKIRASNFGRHLHDDPYASLLLSGCYEEAGDQGRFRLEAGDVVFHSKFEAHLDRFSKSGAIVLNLPMPMPTLRVAPLATVRDPEMILRVANEDAHEALQLVLSLSMSRKMPAMDWPDELAAALLANPTTKLGHWAERYGLAPWSLTRGFAQVFGVSPEAFRARSRTRTALKLIEATQRSMATISSELGFADQAHMTRSIVHLTGLNPKTCRNRANGFKTGS